MERPVPVAVPIAIGSPSAASGEVAHVATVAPPSMTTVRGCEQRELGAVEVGGGGAWRARQSADGAGSLRDAGARSLDHDLDHFGRVVGGEASEEVMDARLRGCATDREAIEEDAARVGDGGQVGRRILEDVDRDLHGACSGRACGGGVREIAARRHVGIAGCGERKPEERGDAHGDQREKDRGAAMRSCE